MGLANRDANRVEVHFWLPSEEIAGVKAKAKATGSTIPIADMLKGIERVGPARKNQDARVCRKKKKNLSKDTSGFLLFHFGMIKLGYSQYTM